MANFLNAPARLVIKVALPFLRFAAHPNLSKTELFFFTAVHGTTPRSPHD